MNAIKRIKPVYSTRTRKAHPYKYILGLKTGRVIRIRK